MTITQDSDPVIAARIESVLEPLGVRGYVHAVDIDSGVEVGLDADTDVVTASVFKLPVLVELARQYEAGALDPRRRIRVGADERRTDGPTGLSILLDDVELSLRDLSVLMMSVSDNRATDLITDLVGLDSVNATMRSFGLERTVVPVDCDALFRMMAEDLGESLGELEVRLRAGTLTAADLAQLQSSRVSNPESNDRTTPREITTLLAAVWRDEVIGAAAAAEVRRVLGLQAWSHRLVAGFPDSRVKVSGKTGTLFFIRNEAGVVEYPDGGRYAVGVFLRESSLELRHPDADRAIGTVARVAVDALRSSQGLPV
ncbi:serine hydrolase [Plantibacter sp. PA-3-X8]|uniref:serine hydrolase n=1 Tax=Plantibacter sp. PA-3-X8 TaxID=2480625 RepID=UPI000F5D73E0|nr:serine hydrolase [Plantibacter sp. PA-3-X8]AZH82030.1 serine hydrolase [Plantibacter sp. PA-3-X8]